MVDREVVEIVASEGAQQCFANFLAFRRTEVRDCTIWRLVVKDLACDREGTVGHTHCFTLRPGMLIGVSLVFVPVDIIMITDSGIRDGGDRFWWSRVCEEEEARNSRGARGGGGGGVGEKGRRFGVGGHVKIKEAHGVLDRLNDRIWNAGVWGTPRISEPISRCAESLISCGIYIHKGRMSISDWPIGPLIISEASRTPIGRSREGRTQSGAHPSRVVRPGHVR